jgi:hypothetical protein
MSDPNDFLARWSRRKRQAADEVVPATAGEPGDDTERAPERDKAVETPAAAAQTTQPAKEPFDPASLPSIESITAATDIRAFLAPGVPVELTRAALRRMWAADPQIRDFVGLAEYAWDFNASDSMPGFSPLEMTDALRAQIARMFSPPPAPQISAGDAAGTSPQLTMVAKELTSGERVPAEPAAAPIQDQEAKAQDELSGQNEMAQRNKDSIAPQYEVSKGDDMPSTVPRRHGGALPK